MPVQIGIGNLNLLKSSIKDLVGAMDRLDATIQKTTSSASALRQILGTPGSVKKFGEAIATLNTDKAKGLESIGRGLDSLTAAVKRFNSVGTTFPTNLNSLIRVVGSAFNQMSNLKPLDKGITSSINSLQYILTAFSHLAASPIDTNALNDQVKNIVSILSTSFTSLTKVSNTIGAGSADTFKILSSKMASLITFLPQIDALAKTLPKIPTGFFSSLKLRFSKDDQIKNLKNLFEFFKFIGEGLGSISNSIGSKVDLSSLDTISQVIGRLSKALPAIQAAAKNLPKGTSSNFFERVKSIFGRGKFAEFKEFINFVKFISNSLAGIGKDQDLGNLSAMAEAITRVSKSVPAILNAAKVLPKGAKFNFIDRFKAIFGGGKFASIKEFFTFVKFIADQLVKLPVIKTNAPQLFTALAEMSKNLSGAPFEAKSLKGLAGFVKELSRGLAALKDLKIDEKQLDIAQKAASILPHLSEIQNAKLLAEQNNKLSPLAVLKSAVNAGSLAGGALIVLQGLKSISSAMSAFKTTAIETFKSLGVSLRSFGLNLERTGQTIIQKFGIDKFFKSSGANLAADFEDLSIQLKVFAKDIPLDQAQAFADEIGIKYPLSANQALKATLDLSKAGLDFPDIRKVLPSAADLAALSGGDLDRATQSLITAAKVFTRFTATAKGGFENITIAANLYSAAADVSTASTQEIADAVAAVGPIANQAGLSLEQVAAASAILADRGIKGAEAGTALRSALTALQRPQATKELTRLGIAMYNADGSARDFNLILKELNETYTKNNFSQVEVTNSLNQLADVHGRTALSVLLTAGGFDKTTSAMNKTATAADRAQTLMSSFKGILTQLRGSVETLQKNAFLPLVERVLKPLAEGTLLVVNSLLRLPKPILNTVVTMAALISVGATLVGTFLIVGGAIASVAGAFLSLIGNIGLIAINLPLITSAALTFAAAFITLLPIITLIASGVIGLATAIESVFSSIEQNIGGAGEAFKNFKDQILVVFTEVKRIASTFLEVIDIVFGSLFKKETEKRGLAIANVFNTLSNKLKAIAKTLKDFNTDKIVRFFVSIKPEIDGLIKSVSAIGGGIFDTLLGKPEGLARLRFGVTDLLSNLVSGLSKLSGFDLSKSILSFKAGDIVSGIKDFFKGVLAGLTKELITHQDFLEKVGTTLLNYFFNPFKSISTFLNFLGIKGPLVDAITGVANFISGTFRKIFDVIFGFLKGEDPEKLFTDTFGKIGGTIIRFANEILRTAGLIKDSILLILDAVGQLFSGIDFKNLFGSNNSDLNNIEQTISSIIDSVTAFVKNFNDNVLQPFKNNLPGIIRDIKFFAGQVITALAPLIGFTNDLIVSIGGFFDEVRKVFGGQESFGDLVQSLADKLSAALSQLPHAIGRTLKNLGFTIGSVFLVELGDALDRGYLLQFIGKKITDFVSAIPQFISNAVKNIGHLFTEAGRLFGLTFLTKIGNFLEQGDAGGAVSYLTSALVKLIFRVVDSALKFGQRAIDHFLDLFQNRIVGGIVLAIGIALTAALPIVAPLIISAIGGLLTSVISSIAASIGGEFALGIIGSFGALPVAAIAAAVVGVFGLIAYTVLNDPDADQIGAAFKSVIIEQLSPKTLSETLGQNFQKGLDEAYRTRVYNSIVSFFGKTDKLVYDLSSKAFAFGGLLDAIGISLNEIADGLKTKIKEAFNFIPQFFADQAQQAADETTKSFLTTISNVAKGLIGSVSSIIALPIQTVGSVVSAIGALVQLTVEHLVGVYNFFKGIIVGIAGFVGQTIHTIGGFIGGLLDTLGVLGNGIRGIFKDIQNFLNQLSTGVGSFVSGIVEIAKFVLPIGGAIAALILYIRNLKTVVQDVKTSVDSTYIAFEELEGAAVSATKPSLINRIKGFGSSFLSVAKQAIGAIAVVTVTKGIADGVREIAKTRNLWDGIIAFFKNMSDTILDIVGLSDAKDKINTTFDQVRLIGEAALNFIGRRLDELISKFLASFQDLRARIEEATGGTEFSKAFFKLTDTITGKDIAGGVQTIEAYGKKLGTALTESMKVDPSATRAVVLANWDTISDQFSKTLSEPGGFEKLSDEAQKGFAEAFTVAGRVQQGLRQFTNKNQGFDLISFFFKLDPKTRAKNLADYIDKVVELGLNEGLDQAQIKKNYEDDINSALNLGEINTQQAADFWKKLGLNADQTKVAVAGATGTISSLNQSLTDLYNSQSQAALAKLKKDFEGGVFGDPSSQAALDKYNAGLDELGQNILKNIDLAKEQKQADLGVQLRTGQFGDPESQAALATYTQKFKDLETEADNLKFVKLSEEMNRLSEAAGKTKGLQQATEEMQKLKEQMDAIKSVPQDLKDRLTKYYSDFAAGLIKGRQAADEYNAIIDEIKKRQDTLNEGPDNRSFLQKLFDAAKEGSTGLPPVVDNPDLLQQQQEDADKIAQVQEDIKKKTEEFNISQSRQREDDERDEQNKLADIQKIKDDAAQEEFKKLVEYNNEARRLAEDHALKLQKIDQDSADSIEEAVASRSSDAAQKAVKERDKKKKDENDQFQLEQNRRAEDFANQQYWDQISTKEKVDNATKDYNDLVAKNQRERQRKLEDYNRDILELQSKLTTETAIKSAANSSQEAQLATHNQNMALLTESGLKTAYNQWTGFLNSVLTSTTHPDFGKTATAATTTPIQPVSFKNFGTIGGFAGGGTALAGRRYRVAENNQPELYRQGGKTYLIPGQRGEVIPARPGLPRGGDFNLSLDLGGINIQGGTNVGAADLVSQIEKQLIPKLTGAIRESIPQAGA